MLMYFDPTADLIGWGIKPPAGSEEAAEMAAIVSALAFEKPAEVMPTTTSAETVQADLGAYVQAMAVHRYAMDVNRHFEQHARAGVRHLYIKAAPDLIEPVRKKAAKPLKVIATAAAVITPDDDGDSILARGDQAAIDTWRKREAIDAAASELCRVADVTEMLGYLAGKIPGNADSNPILWWTAVTDHNHLDRLTAEVKGADCPGGMFLALIHKGHALEIATPEEYAKRLQAVAASRHAEATRGQRAVQEREEEKNRRVGQKWLDALSGGAA